MIAGLTSELKTMKEKGFEFKSVKILEPSDPVRVGKDIYIGLFAG